jgi:hypothetical protein
MWARGLSGRPQVSSALLLVSACEEVTPVAAERRRVWRRGPDPADLRRCRRRAVRRAGPVVGAVAGGGHDDNDLETFT